LTTYQACTIKFSKRLIIDHEQGMWTLLLWPGRSFQKVTRFTTKHITLSYCLTVLKDSWQIQYHCSFSFLRLIQTMLRTRDRYLISCKCHQYTIRNFHGNEAVENSESWSCMWQNKFHTDKKVT